MPLLAPGPLESTPSAIRWPLCSTHHTPSSGTANSRSFWKLKPAKTTAATVSRNNRTATKRAWLSRFMGFGAGPEAPKGFGGVEETSHRSSMSNFAATSNPILGRLSPADKTTSKIIDAFSNSNYVFLDVSVKFSIHFPLRFLGLAPTHRLTDSTLREKYDDPEPLQDVGRNDNKGLKPQDVLGSEGSRCS